MQKYDAIIIGSGLGGLTCGSLLSKHGLKTLILEQHYKAGGFVTSFHREGFTFDTLHVISGLKEGGATHRILKYLGIDKRVKLKELDKVFRFIYPDLTLNGYADITKFEAELSEKFPTERKKIKKLFLILNKIWDESLASYYRPGLFTYLMYPLLFPSLVRYKGKTFTDLLRGCALSSRLQEVVSSGWGYIGLEPDRMAAFIGACVYLSYLRQGAFVPEGGFQTLSDAFAACFQENGGILRYKTRVNRILIEGKRAAGVELDTGEQIQARHIISNSDTKRTFLQLLGKEVIGEKRAYKIESLEQSVSAVSVHLGVKMDIPSEFACGTNIFFPYYGVTEHFFAKWRRNEMELNPKKMLFGLSIPSLKNPVLAPKGCHCVEILYMPAPYNYKNYWIKNDNKKYINLKNYIGDQLIKAAEQLIPGLSRNIVVKDISTPLTYQRCTSSTNGGWYDIAASPRQSGLDRTAQKTSIKGLFMTGAKAFPGHGFFGAVLSGSFAADEILNRTLLRGRVLFKAF